MPQKIKAVTAILRIEGGYADEGLIDIHDAGEMITGLARSMNIIAHALGNDNEVRQRASSATGAKTYIRASTKGCFEEHIEVHFDQSVLDKIGASVVTNHFWSYLVWSWGHTIGNTPGDLPPFITRIADLDYPVLDELSEVLEGSLLSVHAPLVTDSGCTIFIGRPRIGDILSFNSDSLAFLKNQTEDRSYSYIKANVTKFNILSGYGRIYSDQDGTTVAFKLENKDDQRTRDLVIKSMARRSEGNAGKMRFKVIATRGVHGNVKKYKVFDVLEDHED
jgi:hypothetical protein